MHPQTLHLIKTNPEVKDFMGSAKMRFEHGTTTCDGEDCYTQLTPTDFYVHLPPGEKPMMLCVRCLHKYRVKNNVQFNN